MWNWICGLFGKLLMWLFELCGNYGVAVILFALVVKLILLPFQLKSKKSMMRTSRMTPRLKELEKKFGNDRQKYQEQVNKLYKEEGVNPMSGCLWSLLPFPILFALYRAIRFPITVMMGVSGDLMAEGGAIYQKLTELGFDIANFSASRNAAGYEEIFQSQFITQHFEAFQGLSDKLQALSYNFLGIDLGQTPTIKFWAWDWSDPSVWGPALGLFLIPVISALLSYLSMKISQASTPQTMDQQQSNRTMMLTMPLVSLWICFTMPGVMGIYWIAQSVFSIVQEAILNRIFTRQLDIEDADRIAREKAREAELEAKRQETERLRAEGATQVNRSTSKKKQQAYAAQKEVERKAAEKRAARAAKKGITLEDKPESQVGERRYARGRAYVADRYLNPTEAEEKTAAALAESEEYEQDAAEAAAETVEAAEVAEEVEVLDVADEAADEAEDETDAIDEAEDDASEEADESDEAEDDASEEADETDDEAGE